MSAASYGVHPTWSDIPYTWLITPDYESDEDAFIAEATLTQVRELIYKCNCQAILIKLYVTSTERN